MSRADAEEARGFGGPGSGYEDSGFNYDNFFNNYNREGSGGEGGEDGYDYDPRPSDDGRARTDGGSFGQMFDKTSGSYDHAATVARYRAYLRGQIKYWDPADELAAAEAEALGKKFTPRTGAMMVGVRRLAPGQSVPQLLEVRSSIRQMASRNKRARAEHVDTVDPKSIGYREQRERWQDPAIDEFITEFFDGPSQLLPNTVCQSRSWLDTLDVHHFNTVQKYDNLTVHGNMIASALDTLKFLFDFGHATRAALLSWLVSLSGMRWTIGMRPAILFYGDMSTSKSYLFNAVEILMQPGCFESYTHQTAMSQTGDTDADCVVRAQDECEGALVGATEYRDSRDASILKAIQTNHIVRSAHLHTADGERTAVMSVRSCIGTILLATNCPVKEPKKSPWLARLIVWHLKRPSAEDQASIEEKIYKYTSEYSTPGKEQAIRNMKLLSFYVMFVEMAIASNVIDDVTMDSAVAYFQMFNDHMKESGHGIDNPKSVVQAQEVVRTLTIVTACHYVLTGPMSKEWRFENGLPLKFRRIAPRALREIERLLVPTMDTCMFVYTLLGHLWVNSEFPEVCAAARQAIFGEEFDEHVDFNIGRELSPLRQTHSEYEFFAEAQRRINAEVDDTARAFRSHRSTMHDAFAAGLQPERDGAVPPAAPHEAHLGDDPRTEMEKWQEAKSFENDMPQFLRATVNTYFLTRYKKVGSGLDDTLLTINPNYIELPYSGSQENFSAVARKLCSIAHAQALESETAVVTRLIEAVQDELDSPIYTYDLVSGKIILDPRYLGKNVKQSMMIKVNSADRAHFRYRTDASDKGYRLFIATHLVVSSPDTQKLLLTAVHSMSNRFTIPRNILTALCVRAPRYSNPEFHGRDAYRTYWELMHVVPVSRDPTRLYVARNPQVFQEEQIFEALVHDQAGSEDIDYDAIRKQTELFNVADSNDLIWHMEPDLYTSIIRLQQLGFDEDREDEYIWPALFQTVKEISGDHGFVYPDSQLRRMQLSQDRAAMSKRVPDQMSHLTVSALQGRTARLTPKLFARLRALGGEEVALGALWNGDKKTNPSTMPREDRDKYYKDLADRVIPPSRPSRDGGPALRASEFICDDTARAAIERTFSSFQFARDEHGNRTGDIPTHKRRRVYDPTSNKNAANRRKTEREEVNDFLRRGARSAMASSAPPDMQAPSYSRSSEMPQSRTSAPPPAARANDDLSAEELWA